MNVIVTNCVVLVDAAVGKAAAAVQIRNDSRRVDIPDASHIMNVQNPSALNEELLAFLCQCR